ncbi:hypothetical protein ACHAPV_006176 [Trichoderma viride]
MQLFNFLAAATLAAATTDFEMKMQVHYNATYDTKTGIDSPQTDSICQRPSTFVALSIEFPHNVQDKHEFSYPWPYVGGYAPIKEGDFNSCFNCYRLQYGEKSIYFRAINSAKDGVELGRLLFEELSGGKVAELKHINATISMPDDGELCNMKQQLASNPFREILPHIIDGY